MIHRIIYTNFYNNYIKQFINIINIYHEGTHALMCYVFLHNIIDISIFKDPHVNHTYSTKNYYQMAGNFFISISPFLGILFLYIFFHKIPFIDYVFAFLFCTFSAPSWVDLKISLKSIFCSFLLLTIIFFGYYMIF